MKKSLKIIITTAIFLSASFTASVNCSESDEHEKNLHRLEEERKVESTTLLFNNSGNILPLKNLEHLSIACINIDSEYSGVFNSMMNRYSGITMFTLPPEAFKPVNRKVLSRKLRAFNTVIILTTDRPFTDPAVLKFVINYQKSKHLILCITGNRDILGSLDNFRQPVLITGIKSEISTAFLAQAVFGGVSVSSKLDTSLSSVYTEGSGDIITPVRLKYTVPEDAGINCADLIPVEGIMNEAINRKMTPGAIIIVVKNGKVILEKAYGYHTYECREPVSVSDIYDLASITKAAASAIAVMRLYEQKKINLDKPLSSYLPETRKTDKKNITIRELMLHRAGLASYIQFSRKIRQRDFRRKKSSVYNVPVADHYYLKKGYYKKFMWPVVLKCPLESKGKYAYSDLGMFFIKEIIERKSGNGFDKYLYNNFYKPLGMQTMCFNPRGKFNIRRIVPTEIDSFFRKTTLRGYVHDQAAAMMGGVAGHAGLFSDANDLAILFQMLLNRGSYGGSEYLKGETVDIFTEKQSDLSRRVLGFDSWDPESEYGYPSPLSPEKIFGHTGFTGTCAWCDPENNLIFIFLSNRTYPATPNRLAENNIRSRILDVIYRAIGKG